MREGPQSRPRALSVFYGCGNIVGVKQTYSLKFNHGGELDGSDYTEQLSQLEKQIHAPRQQPAREPPLIQDSEGARGLCRNGRPGLALRPALHLNPKLIDGQNHTGSGNARRTALPSRI